MPRCLECHASFFEPVADRASRIDIARSNYILGISCEKCHGPGKQHADLNAPGAAETLGPGDRESGETAARSSTCVVFVVSWRDWCRESAGVLFHGWKRARRFPPARDSQSRMNRSMFMAIRWRCWRGASASSRQTMTCSTCHNVHMRQREVGDFSAKCLTCHKVESCGLFPRRGRAIAGKCVDCHLPNQTSNVIYSTHDGVRIRPKVRNHWIKVY